MAGHSKWKNIKRQKEANDKERSKIFAKISRLITMSVINGGGIAKPEHNISLRLAIEKAKEANMPKDNVARAIEKGTGPNKTLLSELRYEAFGPGGVAFYIIATTDNPNRTAAEIKNILEMHGGKLGSPGSVSYLFQQCGYLSFDLSRNKEGDILDLAEKVNAFDIEESENVISVYFPYEQMKTIGTILIKSLNQASTPEMILRPHSPVEISKETESKVIELIKNLDEIEDVQEVAVNAILSGE